VRFGPSRVFLVGDRGMITKARIREDLQPNGLDWISSLRAPQIQALVNEGQLQLKVGKHFRLAVSERNFTFARDEAAIGAEAALDGIYVVRTSLAAADLGIDSSRTQ
jgi:hypothetical protein